MVTVSKPSRGANGRIPFTVRVSNVPFDASIPPALSRAARAMLAALEQEDRLPLRAQLETAMTAMIEAVGKVVRTGIEWSRATRAHYQRFAAEVGGSPGDEFDEVGRAVSGELDETLRVLVDLHDGPVQELTADGVTVPGHDELETEIRDMEAFRASLIGGWPWSHLPLPASDPAMLAQSRAEIERGEGIPIEELIRQLKAGG